ncbi:MAG: hypothetical protein QNJ30_19125 [Kiloniellales bacterium]|nr:hypothetical protein [Kiloniellales bacterium]
MVRYGIIALAFVLVAARPGAAAAEGKVPTIDEVMQAIGFTAEDEKALLAGEIVSHDLDRVGEKEIIAAVAMRLPVPLAKFEAAYPAGSDIELDANNLSFSLLGAPPKDGEWAKLAFDGGDKDELGKILRAKPGDDLNLSAEEFAQLGERLSAVSADQDGAAAAVSEAYRDLMKARFAAYLERGLDGVAAYDRGGGKAVSPAEEIRMTWRADDDFFETYFPALNRAFLSFPQDQPAEVENEFAWRKQKVEGRPAFILQHNQMQRGEDYIVWASKQFFVGHTYNSQVTGGLVLPVEEGSIVFYFNSTSTDKIAGFFSGVASSVGQSRMNDSIKSYFDSARKRSSN